MSNTPPVPNRVYYESEPGAAAIRDLCLDGTAACEDVLAGDRSAIGTLLDVNRELSEAGITPNMHTIANDDPDAETKQLLMMHRPRQTAEWVGGQLLHFLLQSGLLETPDPAVIGEFNELGGDTRKAVMLDSTKLPQAVDFAINLRMVGLLQDMLDVPAGKTSA